MPNLLELLPCVKVRPARMPQEQQPAKQVNTYPRGKERKPTIWASTEMRVGYAGVSTENKNIALSTDAPQ